MAENTANAKIDCAPGSHSSQEELPDSVLCMLQHPSTADPDSVKKFLLESHFSDWERIICNTSGSEGCGQLNKEKLRKLQQAFYKVFQVPDSDKIQSWQNYCSFIDRAGDRLRTEHYHVSEEVIQRVAHDCGHDIFHIIQRLSRHILTDNERTFMNSKGIDGFQPLPEPKLNALRDAFLRIYKLPQACEQEVWTSCLKQIDTEALVRRTQYMEKLFPHCISDLTTVKSTDSIPKPSSCKTCISPSPSTVHVREYGKTSNGETNQNSGTQTSLDVEVQKNCQVESISSSAVEEYEEVCVTETCNPASRGSQAHFTPQLDSRDMLTEGNGTDLPISPCNESNVMSSKRTNTEGTNNEAKKQKTNSAAVNPSEASRQDLSGMVTSALQAAQSDTNSHTVIVPTTFSPAFPTPEATALQSLPPYGGAHTSVQVNGLATPSQSVFGSFFAPQITPTSHSTNIMNLSCTSQSMHVPAPVTLLTTNSAGYPGQQVGQFIIPNQMPVPPPYQGSQPFTQYVVVGGAGAVQRPPIPEQPNAVSVLPYPHGYYKEMNALPPPQAPPIQNWHGPFLSSHAKSGPVSNSVSTDPCAAVQSQEPNVRLSNAGLTYINVAVPPAGKSLILVNSTPGTVISAPSVQNDASSAIVTTATAVDKQMEYSAQNENFNQKLETYQRKRKAHFQERKDSHKKGKTVHNEEVDTNQSVTQETEVTAEDDLVQKLQAVSGHKLYVIVELVKHCVRAPPSFRISAHKLTKKQFKHFRRLYARVYKTKLHLDDIRNLKKLIKEVRNLPLHEFGVEEAKKVHEAVGSLASVGLAACQKVNKLAAVLFSEAERTYSCQTGRSSYPPFCKSRLFVLCHAYFLSTGCQWEMQSREAANVRTMLYCTARERRHQLRLRGKLCDSEGCLLSPDQHEERDLQRKRNRWISNITEHTQTAGQFMEEWELGAYVMSHADYLRVEELFPFRVYSRRKAIEVLAVVVLSTEELLLCANKAVTKHKADIPVKFAFLRQLFFHLFPQARRRHHLEWRFCCVVLSEMFTRIEKEACIVQCLAFPVKVKLHRPGQLMRSSDVQEGKWAEETEVPPHELRLPERADGAVNLGAYVIDSVIALHLDVAKNYPSEDSREGILKHIIKKIITDDRLSNSVHDIPVYLALLRQCFLWIFPDELDDIWARRWKQCADYVKCILERQEDCLEEQSFLMPKIVPHADIKLEDTDESAILVFGATCPVDRLGATVPTLEELSEIENIRVNQGGIEQSYAKKAAVRLLLSQLFKEGDLMVIPVSMALSGLPCSVSKLTRLRYAFFWLFPQSTLEQVSSEWAWCWAQVNTVLREMLRKGKFLTAKLSVPHMTSEKLPPSDVDEQENGWDSEQKVPFFVRTKAVEQELFSYHQLKNVLTSSLSVAATYLCVKHLRTCTFPFGRLGSYVMTSQEAAWTEHFKRKCWLEKLEREQVVSLIVQSLYTKTDVVALYHFRLQKKKIFCEVKLAILCQMYHMVFPPMTASATEKSWQMCSEMLMHVCRILKDKVINDGLRQHCQRLPRRKKSNDEKQEQKLLPRLSRRKKRNEEKQEQKLLSRLSRRKKRNEEKQEQKFLSRLSRRKKRNEEKQDQKLLKAQETKIQSKVHKALEESHSVESERNRCSKEGISTSSECEQGMTKTDKHLCVHNQRHGTSWPPLPYRRSFHPGFVKLLERFAWDVKVVVKLMMRNLFEEDELLECACDIDSAVNDRKFRTCYTTFCDIFGHVERSIFTTLVQQTLHDLSQRESSTIWDRWTDRQEQEQVKKCAWLTAYGGSTIREKSKIRSVTARLCKVILGVRATLLPARKLSRCKYIASKLFAMFFTQEERVTSNMTGLQGMCRFDPKRIAVLRHVTFTLARVAPSQHGATWKKCYNDVCRDSHLDVYSHLKEEKQGPTAGMGTGSSTDNEQLSFKNEQTESDQAQLKFSDVFLQELSQSDESPLEVLKKLMVYLLPCTGGQYRSFLCVSEKMTAIREAFWNICKISESRREETWNSALKSVWCDQDMSVDAIPFEAKPESLATQIYREPSSPNQLIQEKCVPVTTECESMVSVEGDDGTMESNAYTGPSENAKKANEEYVMKSVLAYLHEHVRTGHMHQDEVIDELILYIFSGEELLEYPTRHQLIASHQTETLKAAVSELYSGTEDTMKSIEKLIEDRLISTQNKVKTQLKWMVSSNHEKDERNKGMPYPQMQNLPDRVNEMRSLLMTHVTAADRVNMGNGNLKQLRSSKAKTVMKAFQRYCRETGGELDRKNVMILIYNLTIEIQDIVRRSLRHRMEIAVHAFVAQSVSNLEKKAEMLDTEQSASTKVLFESVLQELIGVFQTAGLVPVVRVLVNYLFTHNEQVVLASSSASQWQRELGTQMNLLERTILKVLKTPLSLRENVWSCIKWIISQEVTNVPPAKSLQKNSLFHGLATPYRREAVRKCVLEAFLTADEQGQFWDSPHHFEESNPRSVSQIKNMYFFIRNVASHEQVHEWELVCTPTMHDEGAIVQGHNKTGDDTTLPGQETLILPDKPAVQTSLDMKLHLTKSPRLDTELDPTKLPSKDCDGKDNHIKDDHLGIAEQRQDDRITDSSAGKVSPNPERIMPHATVSSKGNNFVSSDIEGNKGGQRADHEFTSTGRAAVSISEDIMHATKLPGAVDEDIVDEDIVDIMDRVECKDNEKMISAGVLVRKCAESDMQTCFQDKAASDEQVQEWELVCTTTIHAEGVIVQGNDKAGDDNILPGQETLILPGKPAVQTSRDTELHLTESPRLDTELDPTKSPSKDCGGKDNHIKDDHLGIAEQRRDDRITDSSAGKVSPNPERIMPHATVSIEGNNFVSSDIEGNIGGQRADHELTSTGRAAVSTPEDIMQATKLPGAVDEDIVDTMDRVECKEDEKMLSAGVLVGKCAESDMQACLQDEAASDAASCVAEEEHAKEEDIVSMCKIPSADNGTQCKEAACADDTPISAVSVQKAVELDWETCAKVLDKMIDREDNVGEDRGSPVHSE